MRHDPNTPGKCHDVKSNYSWKCHAAQSNYTGKCRATQSKHSGECHAAQSNHSRKSHAAQSNHRRKSHAAQSNHSRKSHAAQSNYSWCMSSSALRLPASSSLLAICADETASARRDWLAYMIWTFCFAIRLTSLSSDHPSNHSGSNQAMRGCVLTLDDIFVQVWGNFGAVM